VVNLVATFLPARGGRGFRSSRSVLRPGMVPGGFRGWTGRANVVTDDGRELDMVLAVHRIGDRWAVLCHDRDGWFSSCVVLPGNRGSVPRFTSPVREFFGEDDGGAKLRVEVA